MKEMGLHFHLAKLGICIGKKAVACRAEGLTISSWYSLLHRQDALAGQKHPPHRKEEQ